MNSVTFSAGVGGDGSTVTDDNNPATGLGGGGHRARLVPAFSQVVALAAFAKTKAADAAASAVAAAASAALNGTSASARTPALGVMTFDYAAPAGKIPLAGMRMRAASAAAPTSNFAVGTVTAYAAPTITLQVDNIGAAPANAADWNLVFGEGQAGTVSVLRSARAANNTLGIADKGLLIDATGGTWSQLYDACATLTDGWFCYYRNSGAGVITHDPYGAETIGGVATASMNPGDLWLIQCNGANLTLLRLQGSNCQTIASGTGTFTVPAGVYRLWREVHGGGGGGAVPNNNNVPANGGGAGAYAAGWLTVTPGQAISYAVGAAGTGATVNDTDGTAGGNTTFGVLTANGGAAGVRGTSAPAVGGTATGGDLNIDGQAAILAPLSAGALSRGGSAPRGGTGGYVAYDGTNYYTKAPVGPGAGGYGGRSPGGVVTAASAGTAGQIYLAWS